jgi:hypothetical protein
MNLKRIILNIFLFFVSFSVFAQLDAEQFKKFEGLTKEDELIVNVNNYGCSINYYTRYVFYINSKGYRVKKFLAMPSNTFVDGEKWSTERLIKLEEEQRNFKLFTLTQMQYLNWIEELRQIVNSNNSDAVKIAGDGVKLEINFNGKTFSREYRGWIEFKTLAKKN